MKGPWPFIPTIPFRVVLGYTIPKPRQPERYRTIWNASVAGPHIAKSAVDNGGCLTLPVKGNGACVTLLVACTDGAVLTPYKAMAWLSIELECFKLHILLGVASTGGKRIEQLSHDFSHWFKMFFVGHTEQWKACAFFCNPFYIDVRAQMGQLASSHLGQRTSFLNTLIAMRRDEQNLLTMTQKDGV